MAEDEVEALVFEGKLLGVGLAGLDPIAQAEASPPSPRGSSSIPVETSVATRFEITPSCIRLSEK